jgi:hypothetical protein
MITLLDSRGKASGTLPMVVVSWLAVLSKFIVAGVALGPLGTPPPMSATEFGLAVTGILAIWIGREAIDKKAGA